MDLISMLETKVVAGTVIPKPQAQSNFVVKGWGVRRGERALIYSIPNRSNPNSPYEKGVTLTEFIQAFESLSTSGSFSRQWFKEAMEPCAKEGGCNFTTIGGVFELLGLAAYRRAEYLFLTPQVETGA